MFRESGHESSDSDSEYELLGDFVPLEDHTEGHENQLCNEDEQELPPNESAPLLEIHIDQYATPDYEKYHEIEDEGAEYDGSDDTIDNTVADQESLERSVIEHGQFEDISSDVATQANEPTSDQPENDELVSSSVEEPNATNENDLASKDFNKEIPIGKEEALISSAQDTSKVTPCSPKASKAFLIVFVMLVSFFVLCIIAPSSESCAGDQYFHMDRSLVREWNRAKESCLNKCCFEMFILLGDASSHSEAVRKLMNSSQKMHQTDAKSLIKHLGSEDWEQGMLASTSFLFVNSADDLQSKHLEMLYRAGGKRCKSTERSLFVFLSTNLGSNMLSNPEDVASDRYLESVSSRDAWFSISDIVMKRHHIVHGVKGDRPFKVFKTFFNNHALQRMFYYAHALQRMFYYAIFGFKDRLEQFDMETWLERKRYSLVFTSDAKAVLLKESEPIQDKESWLESKYAVWSKNSTCNAVVYKRSSREIDAFHLDCA